MGYATTVDVELILGQSLTSARATTPGQQIELINIGDERDFNRIPTEVVEYYIDLADSVIDGVISQMYQMPLKKCANGEWGLESDIVAVSGGSDQSDQSDGASSATVKLIELSDACNLLAGHTIVIHDDNTGDEEYHIVDAVLDQFRIQTLDNIEQNYSAASTRILRVQFPPPINQISAKLAASYIYDKYFSAQSDPNVSEYGVEQRKEAIGRLNDILHGKIILKCQHRIGDRWGNPWSDDTYAHRDRGYVRDRDMSQPQ